MNTVRPCWGQSALFDSTDRDDHLRAKEFCKRCPVLDWCTERLAEAQRLAIYGGGPEGTWAGQLLLAGRVATTACDDCGAVVIQARTGPHRQLCPDCARRRGRRERSTGATPLQCNRCGAALPRRAGQGRQRKTCDPCRRKAHAEASRRHRARINQQLAEALQEQQSA